MMSPNRSSSPAQIGGRAGGVANETQTASGGSEKYPMRGSVSATRSICRFGSAAWVRRALNWPGIRAKTRIPNSCRLALKASGSVKLNVALPGIGHICDDGVGGSARQHQCSSDWYVVLSN